MQFTIYEPIILATIHELLDLLNEERKDKEKYLPHYEFTEGKYRVFMAANSNKEMIFNILDEFGNIPQGFPVNWRSMSHILQDLKIEKFTP